MVSGDFIPIENQSMMTSAGCGDGSMIFAPLPMAGLAMTLLLGHSQTDCPRTLEIGRDSHGIASMAVPSRR
jgi:hypothetical protein